jgi:L-amino acid N-acyltransferase YncA
MTPAASFAVRDAAEADIPAITAIYAHHVRNGLGSFEEEPPSQEEIARRHRDVAARHLPYLVGASPEGLILGYAYAAPYRPRSAYRFSVEDSVYVAPEAGRQGVGRRLLAAVIDRCVEAGYRQMVAVIGDSGNAASIALHERLGFLHIGVLPAVGFKHGRWVDTVVMQRALGDGAAGLP